MERAYKAGPKLLSSLGAKVVAIGIDPNGLNINNKVWFYFSLEKFK